jgi:hypothetical protein
MNKEITEESIEKLEKRFLSTPTEEETQEILNFNLFVRSSAHTALEQIYKDALSYVGEGAKASMLVTRVINLLYQDHHLIMLYAPELNQQEG